ncbi:hypothetical protein [Wenxinia marina]|uniref:50S ribosomal protein L35 n=1 Tax=Wenxinia marina DSM 24838 TaxID=1123501 RepID=A0A0D0Q8R8_9RHOB|nr:hypothetical protein [Wenxinia marina]KIQ70794.1 hypothetical protein Wenmar_00168 [Wenxinia marina DSM 24838]GGL57236.1 hypothetical protein GCM10011392_09640 [Wenxinia marina]
MDTDLYLATGLVLLVLTLPAIVSALTEGRPPRLAAVVLLIGGGLVAFAVTSRPGGYTFAEIPDVLVRVAARIVN